MSAAKHTPVMRYQFGPLAVAVRGLGVYCGGDHLTKACDALDIASLKAANREAWKQRRAANRQSARVNNITVHGWGPYERAAQHSNVAEVVCRETWKRICKATGSAA